MISKTENKSSIELLESLFTVTKKISDSLKYQLTAEQIDSLAQEHHQVMAQLEKVQIVERKPHKELLKKIQLQVQFLQKELATYHEAVKEKLLSFGRKRKQINAYNALT